MRPEELLQTPSALRHPIAQIEYRVSGSWAAASPATPSPNWLPRAAPARPSSVSSSSSTPQTLPFISTPSSLFPLPRLRQLSLSLSGPSLLERIFVHPLHSAHHLLDLLPHIDSLLSRVPVKLIVIDSVAALFRSEFDNTPKVLKRRSGLFFKISSKLKAQAVKHGIAVVVTNQVVDVMDSSADNAPRIGNSEWLYSSGRRVCATLGLSWAHCVNTRLFMWREAETLVTDEGQQLQQSNRRRFIRVVFAPHLPEKE